MPRRKIFLKKDYYYHVYNRSVDRIPIFTQKRDYLRTLDVISYYQFKNTPLPFSRFQSLESSKKTTIITRLQKKEDFLIDIICYCLMPNHFHFLLKQKHKHGIKHFLRKIQNSYAKYFNLKYKRSGPLFQNRFQAVLIEDDQQLLHLNRYIHLNPYSSLIVKNKKELLNYRWSSLSEYLGEEKKLSQPKIILDQFKNRNSYKKFVLNQADYQKTLQQIKHLIIE